MDKRMSNIYYICLRNLQPTIEYFCCKKKRKKYLEGRKEEERLEERKKARERERERERERDRKIEEVHLEH